MKKSTVSSLLCLLAAAIWGLAFSAQKAAIAVPPFMLTAVRGWIAGVFLIFVVLLFDKLRGGERRLFSKRGIDVTKTEWIAGLLCGLVLTCATVFQQFGIVGIVCRHPAREGADYLHRGVPRRRLQLTP